MADADPQAADATTHFVDSQNAACVRVKITAVPLSCAEDDAAPTNIQEASPHATRFHNVLFLDGLRGLAAMLVVAKSAGYMKDQPLDILAVDVFFVLSAFLLTLNFESKARELLAQKASYRRWYLAVGDYFMRRFLRVYPPFAIVATVLALLPTDERSRSLQLKGPFEYELFDVLSFQQHPHILWTLPIEISYYFMIPAFVVIKLKLGRLWWLLGVSAYVLVFYNGLYQWEYRETHDSPWPHYPTFLCGSLAATVYSHVDRLITRHNFVFKPWLYVPVQIAEMVVVVVLLSQTFNGLLFDWIAKNPLPDSNHFASFQLTLLIVCEMLHRGFVASMLEWSLLRYAGKISYSMYLLHIFIVYQPFVVQQRSYYDRFFLTWILVFLLSIASYCVIEWPCQRLASRVSAWIKQQDLAQTASRIKDTERQVPRKATAATAA